MNLFKRITSFLTACAMTMGVGNTLSYGGVNVWAVESEGSEDYSRKCGEDVYWKLSDGVLEIYGTGDMSDYLYDSYYYVHSPWNTQSNLINEVIICEGVTSIGDYAFYHCGSLTSITIPDSVTSIGGNAFLGTPWLDNQRKKSSLVTVNNILIDGRSCKGSVIIPDSVTSIGDSAFYHCESLTSITIPDSVTSIGDHAFVLCESLTSITIPDSITSIGDYAFRRCESLTSITIPDSVTSIGDSAFFNCDSLTSITIPDSVTSIGDQAFSSCESLTSITIPDSVTSIGDSAFSYCESLTSITIPDSVTSIGGDAFSDCKSLTSITIPDSVTSIGGDAFFDTPWLDNQRKKSSLVTVNNILIDGRSCKGSVIIPDSVTSIGDRAFVLCESLTSITIPDSVTSIGDDAFFRCKSLTSITIPDSVTSIGDHAFNCCYSLTSITIPDSVTSIGDYAFRCCESLTSITIPDSVTSIGGGAFYKCHSLTSITIPDSVTSIGDYAFDYCISLTSITIPDSVTSIGYDAFYHCGNLENIYYGGTEEQWTQIHIGYNNSALTSATIHYNYKPNDQFVFPYTNPDNYVADCLNKGIIDPETGKASASGPVVYQSALSHDYTYERLAKALLEDESLLDISNLWTFWSSACNSDFKDLSETQLYEVLIMDYLAYESQSSQYKSDFEAKCAKYGWEIYTGMLDEAIDNFEYLTIPEVLANVDLDVVMQACKDKGYAEKIKKYTELAEGLNDVALTSYDYYQKLSQALAIQETDENRVKFLNAIKESASNNKYMCDAIDNIIKNLEASYAEISFSLGAETMLNFGVSKAWELITDVVPVFKGFEIGVTGFDWLFNSNDTAVNNTKLILLYTLDQYARQALIKANINYTSDPTRENAMTLNDSFESFLVYQEYATNWSRTFISDITFEGMFNIIQNIFSDNRQKNYDEYIAMFDEDVEFCQREINYLSKWQTIYNRIVNAENVFSTENTYSGKSGEDVYWELSDGVLEIYGTGDMIDFKYGKTAPWESYKKHIKKIIIHEGITSIDDGVFADCNSLLSTTIPDSVSSIGDQAFKNCSYLSSVTIPDSVSSIGNYAFYGCNSLSSITIPDSVSSIGNYAFACSDSLSSVIIPNSISSIEDYTFYSCDSLSSITIPEDVSYIGYNAFYNCTSLSSITIPESVSLIKDFAFANCNNLKYVYYVGTEEQWNKIKINYQNKPLTSAKIYCNYKTDNITNDINPFIQSHLDFIEQNPNAFINSKKIDAIYETKKLMYEHDSEITTYNTFKSFQSIIGGDDMDNFHAEITSQAVMADLLCNEETLNALETAAKQAEDELIIQVLDALLTHPVFYKIDETKLAELKVLCDTKNKSTAEYMSKRKEWLYSFIPTVELDLLSVYLDIRDKNGYNLLMNIGKDAIDTSEKYIDFCIAVKSYEAADEYLHQALSKLLASMLVEYYKVQSNIDPESMRIKTVVDEFQKQYLYIVNTVDTRYDKYTSDLLTQFATNTATQSLSAISKELLLTTVKIACPTLGKVLGLMDLTFSIGMNTWEILTNIDERALERDMFLNMIVYYDAIVNAMNGSFKSTLTTDKTLDSTYLYEEGFKFYQKITKMMVDHGIQYYSMLYKNISKSGYTEYDFYDLEEYAKGLLGSDYANDMINTLKKQKSWFIDDEELEKQLRYELGHVKLDLLNEILDKITSLNSHADSAFNMCCHETFIGPSQEVKAFNYNVYNISCPVNIIIKNNTTIVAKVENDIIKFIAPDAPIYINSITEQNDTHASKFVITPFDYDIEIIGYANGAMDYEKIIVKNNNITSISTINNIPVKAGSTYTEVIEENKTIAMECDLDNNGTADETVKAQRDPEGAYGDVNGDGVVTATDMSELILILIGKKIEYDKNSADIDSDSLITISDLVKLRMYIIEQSIA